MKKHGFYSTDYRNAWRVSTVTAIKLIRCVCGCHLCSTPVVSCTASHRATCAWCWTTRSLAGDTCAARFDSRRHQSVRQRMNPSDSGRQSGLSQLRQHVGQLAELTVHSPRMSESALSSNRMRHLTGRGYPRFT